MERFLPGYWSFHLPILGLGYRRGLVLLNICIRHFKFLLFLYSQLTTYDHERASFAQGLSNFKCLMSSKLYNLVCFSPFFASMLKMARWVSQIKIRTSLISFRRLIRSRSAFIRKVCEIICEFIDKSQ